MFKFEESDKLGLINTVDTAVYLQNHKQAIINDWLRGDANELPATIPLTTWQQMADGFLTLLIGQYNGRFSHKFNLTEWATIYQQQHPKLTATHMIDLIQSVRPYLINGLCPDMGLPFLLDIDRLLNQPLKQLLTQPNNDKVASLTNRIHELEQMVIELAGNTDETDRALIQVQTLYDLSRQLGATLDVTAMAQAAVDHLARMTAATSCIVWSLTIEGTLQPIAATERLTLLPTLLPKSKSSLWQSVTHKQPYTLAITECGPVDQVLLEQLGADCMLTIPLVAQSTVLGIITLQGKDGNTISDTDLTQAIAQQLAIGWQNGQLYAEVHRLNTGLERRIAERTIELRHEKELLETIHAITGQLTNTLDLNDLIAHTLRKTAVAVGAIDGLVMLNEDSYSSILICQATLLDQLHDNITPDTWLPLSQSIMANRQPTIINDLHTNEEWPIPQNSIRTIVAAPIKADRDLHGVLLLMHTTPNFFTTSHLRLVSVVATQLATAINNAKLHGYVTEQVLRLGEMLHIQNVEAGQKQAILSSIGDGVIASDEDHHIILLNPAAEQILGQTADQLLGQHIEAIQSNFTVSSQKLLHKAIMTLQEGKTATPGGQQGVTLEIGDRIINTRMAEASTPGEGKIGHVMVLRDISKEVEADRAKTEFITTVSHELRTPMTSIRGYTFLLQQGAGGDITEKQRDFLQVIDHNAERLTLLINDLLDISKVEAGRMQLDYQETDLSQLAETVVKSMLIPAEEKGLTLQLICTAPLPSVLIDRNRISQVLTNLISNAINYTPEGKVTVTLRPISNAVEISVTDTGIGIRVEEQKQIFNRFFRSEDYAVQMSDGTGLGLAIVKSFVEMHEGRIWVASQLGLGSTFTFILPTIDTY